MYSVRTCTQIWRVVANITAVRNKETDSRLAQESTE